LDAGIATSALDVSSRSLEKRFEQRLKQADEKIEKFLLYSDKFKLDISLQSLVKDSLTHVKKDAMREASDTLLQTQTEGRVYSAQYVDKDNKPLFFYFGYRRSLDRQVRTSFNLFRGISHWLALSSGQETSQDWSRKV
jgi:hypothetical protein